MDLGLFLGRFHPLFVHLPIGIILVTLLLEWRGKSSNQTLQNLWWYGFISAMAAAYVGWLLAGEAGYNPGILRWHKWLGFTTCGLSLIIWASYKYKFKASQLTQRALRFSMLVVLGVAGHKGGTLTHGNDYLVKAAPKFVQNLLGFNKGRINVDLASVHPDSILVFEHLVNPILTEKCVDCHNSETLNGGLDMSTLENLLNGGDSGLSIAKGLSAESEIFKRVVLPQSDEKFMPPKGIPMTFYEIDILKRWIDYGALESERISEKTPSSSLINSVKNVYGINIQPRPWYQKDNVSTPDSLVINSLIKKGYQITPFSQEDNYLKIVLPRDSRIDELDLEPLNDNVIVLEAKYVDLSDEALFEVGKLKNLIRLDLSNSTYSSVALTEIEPLLRLEVINLFSSSGDDNLLDHLQTFPGLKTIYTWQSNITNEGIASFESARGDVVIEKGL